MWPTKMFSSVVTTIPTPAFNGNLREVLHKNGNPQLPGTCTALVNELSTTAPADRSEKIQRERFEAAALKFLQASNKCGPCVVACLLNSVKFGDLYALSYESVHDDFVSAWSIEFPPASFEAATDELKRRRRALNALRRYLGRFYS